jgi:2-polyprenyl-3-methyl-5-hydroxy-6-metoxy-1,4-benzoquinol methylase
MGADYFDAMVDTYVDTMRSRNFQARERVFADAARLARERAGESPVCVDVGVGTGYLSRTHASLGFRVIGCDSSREMLVTAGLSVPSAELHLADAAEFLESLAPGTADFVACSSVLEYLDDPLRVVRGAARVLRGGGIFAVSLPERVSLSRMLQAPFDLRRPKEVRYTTQWRNRLGGGELEAAATDAGLRVVYRRRFGSFEKMHVRLPFDAHRPVSTLCLHVLERTG